MKFNQQISKVIFNIGIHQHQLISEKKWMKQSIGALSKRIINIYKPNEIISEKKYHNLVSANNRFSISNMNFNLKYSQSLSTLPSKYGLNTFTELVNDISDYLNKIKLQIELTEISKRCQSLADKLEASDIWESPDLANKFAREHAFLKSIINMQETNNIDLSNLSELSVMALEENDETILKECYIKLLNLFEEVKKNYVELLLDNPTDKNGCIIEIIAGAGGTESCDFTEMLTNMYLRWATNCEFTVKLTDVNLNPEAGYRSSILQIDGINAYGWAKAESGVHRMVRISAYDSQGRRQTCFSKVAVYPLVDDKDTELKIKPAELRIDTFRSSGAGGQHVNTTESAVRITHIPTGIQATCQAERSQHSNKKAALNVLKSRLLALKLDEEAIAKNSLTVSLGKNTFGNQIRSYILHPYKMIKDHRTNHETSQAAAVLNGDLKYLQPFMQTFLLQNLNSRKSMHTMTNKDKVLLSSF